MKTGDISNLLKKCGVWVERQWDEARLAGSRPGGFADYRALLYQVSSFSNYPQCITESCNAPKPHSPLHSSPALIPKILCEIRRSLLKTSLPFGEDWMFAQTGSGLCPDPSTEESV